MSGHSSTIGQGARASDTLPNYLWRDITPVPVKRSICAANWVRGRKRLAWKRERRLLIRPSAIFSSTGGEGTKANAVLDVLLRLRSNAPMKLLSTLALLLAACGPAPSPQASAPIEAAQPVAVQANPAIAPEYLIGRWGDSGDCAKDIFFKADGSFQSYTGGVGQWSVDGAIITMSGEGGVFQLRARAIDANTLELANPDGSLATSQRC